MHEQYSLLTFPIQHIHWKDVGSLWSNSISNVMTFRGKIFQLAVQPADQPNKYLNNNIPIDNQLGFRHNHSCESLLGYMCYRYLYKGFFNMRATKSFRHR